MIIDCAVYQKGKRVTETLSIDGALDLVEDDAFVWLGLYEPTHEEFDEVRIEFGLHQLAAEDAVAAHQRPKLEVYEGSLLVVLKTTRYLDDTEEIEFGEIIMLVGRNYVVIVRHGKASELGSVRRALEETPDMLQYGPTAVLHAVMDRVVDDYAPVVAGLDNDIGEVERDVFSAESTNPTERIYFLKREVLEFKTAVGSLLDPLLLLSRGEIRQVHPGSAAYFRDVYDQRGTRPVCGRPAPGPAHLDPRCQPDPDRGQTERGHAQDLGVAGDRRGPDAGHRHLRDELRAHSRAGPVVGLLRRPGVDGGGGAPPAPQLPPQRLAVTYPAS